MRANLIIINRMLIVYIHYRAKVQKEIHAIPLVDLE